jgi:hypothetical protein
LFHSTQIQHSKSVNKIVCQQHWEDNLYSKLFANNFGNTVSKQNCVPTVLGTKSASKTACQQCCEQNLQAKLFAKISENKMIKQNFPPKNL